jgi:hypothetical protein
MGWLVVTAVLWRGLFLSGVRFHHTRLDYYGWSGKCHSVGYAQIAAVSWRYHHKAVGKWQLSLCRAVEGGGLGWFSLRNENGWRVGLAEAVRDEIVERAGLRALEKEPLPTTLYNDSLWLAEGHSHEDLPRVPL